MELATHLAGFLLVAQYATCLSVTGSLDLSHFLHRSVNTHLPNDKAVNCRQKFKTNVWTGCDDVLSQFQLTLKEFMLANPTIGDACDGFVPGETYCVAFNVQRNVTEDGNCGEKINFSKTCIRSDFGDCCGLEGKCGSGKEFYGDNCQDGNYSGSAVTTSSITAKPSATKPPLSISTNRDYAYNSGFICKGSKFGDCCLAASYCRDDKYHWGKYLGW
ncbi:hypothetical protein BFJ68_g15218 [Fusarium oxysporum]|uniref:LysM domain-containing protein n=1 Tax=Fusarium oxysporum TaxID=5507 RepID=A0A420PPM2_FUSOX|nr:hypothetical protein BFJ68_g15218 [Fusarium oxysporum]